MNQILRCKNDYTIAEITDAEFVKGYGTITLTSQNYGIRVPLKDDEISQAIRSGQAVTAFVSRYKNEGQVHFLVHAYPADELEHHQEEITQGIIRYMILRTIVKFRLDTAEKIIEYLDMPLLKKD